MTMVSAPLPSRTPPTLETWLTLSHEEVAAWVQDQELAVFLGIDGTQRYYLLDHPECGGQIGPDDFLSYTAYAADAYARLFDTVFSLGIKTIMTAVLIDDNFGRGEAYQRQALRMSEKFLLNPPFSGVYQRWKAAARLYGDYAFAPQAAPIRDGLLTLETRLAELTEANHARHLWLGFNAGSSITEMIHRIAALSHELGGREPTEAELLNSWFPAGPTRIHLLINTGWMFQGKVVPPVFASRPIDLYVLNHLVLALQEDTLRRILYDYLFLRHAAPQDRCGYDQADLDKMNEYYGEHRNCFIGGGQVTAGGLWFPDHFHRG